MTPEPASSGTSTKEYGTHGTIPDAPVSEQQDTSAPPPALSAPVKPAAEPQNSSAIDRMLGTWITEGGDINSVRTILVGTVALGFLVSGATCLLYTSDAADDIALV